MNASDIYDWLDGKRIDGLPIPPDTYHAHVTSSIGKNGRPKNFARGQAIQRGRERKKFETNRAALLLLLSTIQFDDKRDILAVSQIIDDYSFAIECGWQYWQKDNRASWIHETETDKLLKAAELGAIRTK